VAINAFRRFVTFLAKMGLIVRDDSPRVIDMTGREWGEPADGLALSIREGKKDDPGQLPVLSVVMRNAGPERKALTIPGWLFFYEITVSNAQPTAYGRELMKPERRTERIELTLGPGDATETDLPIGLLYEMRARGTYRVRVSCHLPDGVTLRSNEIAVGYSGVS
jgi:hypothetical protein